MLKYFDVYKSTKGYYLKEDVCRDFGITNTGETKVIKDVVYYQVPEETISSIEETTKNEAIQYKRNELALFDLQIVLTIKILVDKTNNKKYISLINANKLNVVGNRKTIDNIVYVEISDSKIEEIKESTKKDTIAYNITYEEVELEPERKPAKNLFLYYHDMLTNTLYVTREILDLIRGLDIELETTPAIVDNRNCYSITPEKLKEFETKSVDFRGVEKLIRINTKLEKPEEIFNEQDPVMPYNDGISTIVDEDLMEYNDDLSTVVDEDLMEYNDDLSTVVDETDPVIPYNDEISTIVDETSITNKIRFEVNKALKNFFQKKDFKFEYDPIMPYSDDLSTVVDEDLMEYNDDLSTVVDEDLMDYDDNLSTVVDEDLMDYDDRLSTIIDDRELEAIKANVKKEFEKYLRKKLSDEDIIPYNDDITTVYDETVLSNKITFEINKALRGVFKKAKKQFVYDPVMPYDEDKSTVVDEDLMEYDDALSTVKNESVPTVLVYKDINTGKLYIPEEYAKTKINKETILNKLCYETSIEELETIYNKRFLIIGVSLRPKKLLNIIICNSDGDLFISNEILKQFNITSHYSKMILVNKEIFTQIGNEELDQIENIDLDNTIVKIEIKKIVKIK